MDCEKNCLNESAAAENIRAKIEKIIVRIRMNMDQMMPKIKILIQTKRFHQIIIMQSSLKAEIGFSGRNLSSGEDGRISRS